MGHPAAGWDMAQLQKDYGAYQRQIDGLAPEVRREVRLMTFHEWLRAQPQGYREYHGVTDAG